MHKMNDIEFLPWDSENFGFKVGRFTITGVSNFKAESLYEVMSANDYELIYLVSPMKLDLDEFCDHKLTYQKKHEKRNPEVNAHIHSYKGKQLTESLLNLSLESGKHSRYHIDSKFPQDKFQFLYKKWIENSLLTDYATNVLVYEKEDKPVGLLTYKITDCQSSIGIIATAPEYQGQGIGSSLMRCYETLLPESVNTMEVVTQGVNHSARNFYEKFGYTIAESCYVYHIWSK